ncbi:hypothetical protein yc1106_07788 [Curvularia clavata]|uniref:Uncharacterized protein n=1 Tax=Curvularia clavata TaxID=95742 RepID=A0A9Q9DW46_CURCL|nr:hypothetical protein yc1106_07788 [Curvularia clavata]
MGGPNLEVFKVRFFSEKLSLALVYNTGLTYALDTFSNSHSVMYYFGTNLDGRFSVPDFWPKPGQTHKIPYDRDEIAKELERLKARNLENKRRREERERLREMGEQTREG